MAVCSLRRYMNILNIKTDIEFNQVIEILLLEVMGFANEHQNQGHWLLNVPLSYKVNQKLLLLLYTLLIK